ncbi:MAG: PKD domain-containing protein, partial [Planctomycetota bacterium]
DPDGVINSYVWDFGDGKGGSGVEVEHTYQTAGDYSAILIVTDDGGDTASSEKNIRVSGSSGYSCVLTFLGYSSEAKAGNKPAIAISLNGVNVGFTWEDDPSTTNQSYYLGYADISTYAQSGVNTLLFSRTGSSSEYVKNGAVTVKENGESLHVNAPSGTWKYLSSPAEYTFSATGSGASNITPTAVLSANPESGNAPLEVAFNAGGSSDPDGVITSYEWDFGDGITADGVSVNHTYQNPGTYTATLTVTDNLGTSDSAEQVISVSAIPSGGGEYEITFAGYSSAWNKGYAPGMEMRLNGNKVSCSFEDHPDYADASFYLGHAEISGLVVAGTNYLVFVRTGSSLEFVHNTDMFIVKDGIHLDFTGPTGKEWTNLKYDDAEFTFTGTGGGSGSNEPPVAAATADVTEGYVPLMVNFDASGSADGDGQIVSFEWDYGDGDTAGGVEVSHTFDDPGSFTVVLTVTDDGGAQDTASVLITVSPAAGIPTPTPEENVVILTNRERAGQGLPPLKMCALLNAAAEAHSIDMRDNNFFDHTGSDGSSPWDRMNREGYYMTAAAENIAVGYTTPEAAVQGWMESEGHRANILNGELREIGVGYAQGGSWGHYWTQDFGTRQDVFPVVIGGEEVITNSREVELYIWGSGWAQEMMVSNDPNFSGADWQTCQSSLTWLLNGGKGYKTVYVKLKNGTTVVESQDTIYLNDPTIFSDVYVVIYDPVFENHGNVKMHEYYHWNDPRDLVEQYINDVRTSSHGLVEYRVVLTEEFDLHPVKGDGFSYTDESFIEMWLTKNWHQPDQMDYLAFFERHDIVNKVESGMIDEVWIMGYPGTGCAESAMAGQGAYFCNGPTFSNINCSKKFVVMGFNFERGVGCMLEDLGHRTECIMWHTYGSWNTGSGQIIHLWDKFTAAEISNPGQSGCGNVHFSPNSESDYDWGNARFVYSTCDDWLNNFPDLTGEKKLVNKTEWGGGDIRLHHIWWFQHIPRVDGVNPDGKLNNWWKYIIEYFNYE